MITFLQVVGVSALLAAPLVATLWIFRPVKPAKRSTDSDEHARERFIG